MNGHELWRLRELGLGGFQLKTQESNFWSKYNCPILRWTSEHPRHGFGELVSTSREFAMWPDRLSLPVVHYRNQGPRKRLAMPTTVDPPAKRRRLHSPASERRQSLSPAAYTALKMVPVKRNSQFQGASSQPAITERKGDWYFISSGDSLRESCAAVFPQFAREHHIDLGRSNKVFAARWLSDDRIVMGTKCNSILIMDADGKKSRTPQIAPRRIYNEDEEDDDDEGDRNVHRRRGGDWSSPIVKIQPLKGSYDPLQLDEHCGIHAVDVNPSGTLFASGGHNPADISIFRLPNFEPLTIGETAHKDWMFDLEWLDDEYLMSGSRDSTLALWKFPDNKEDMMVCCHSNRLLKNQDRHGLGHVSVGGRIGNHFGCSYPSSRPVEVKKLQRFDKVRAIKFNHRHKVLASVSLNSYLHVLDVVTFKQRYLHRMDGYVECVSLCNSPDEDLLTVGTRSGFAFYDTRTWDRVSEERLPRRNDDDAFSLQALMPSGVRSMSWRGHTLTLGSGGGEIMFYDVRAKRYLHCDCNRSLTLQLTGGWLQEDEFYRELFHNLPCPNAIYSHCYDQYGTRLFTAGGPIASSLVGNYAAIWG